MRTLQAHRAQKARRIIRRAYRISHVGGPREAVRFELIGDHVALAVVRDQTAKGHFVIRVARQLPGGRVMRLLSECRRGFPSVRDQISYFETLYHRYGGHR